MANPQAENGFTRIANELYDAILKFKCTGLQKELIFAVVRFTYGFNRKEASLSLRFLAQYLDRPYNKVSTTLNKLIGMNILFVKQHYDKNHTSRVLELNKDYDSWNLKTVAKKGTVQQLPKKELYSYRNSNSNSYQKGNKERQLIKTTIKTRDGVIPEESGIPKELIEVQGFIETFRDWQTYRKEIKKPLTPTAIKRQFKQLLEFKNSGYDVVDIISASISSHWQGLFPPKIQYNPINSNDNQPSDDKDLLL